MVNVAELVDAIAAKLGEGWRRRDGITPAGMAQFLEGPDDVLLLLEEQPPAQIAIGVLFHIWETRPQSGEVTPLAVPASATPAEIAEVIRTEVLPIYRLRRHEKEGQQ
jgi:hypothetical protein